MILHVAELEKFIPSFIAFLDENFDGAEHQFWLLGDRESFRIEDAKNRYFVGSRFFEKVIGYLRLFYEINKSRKIVLHGLFDFKTILILFLSPWALHKCCWVIWGGDLYAYKLRSLAWRRRFKDFIKAAVIKRIGRLVTQVEGDYELAKVWYGARGEWHECFVYPSNIYVEYSAQRNRHEGINILLGNSATVSNRHFDALDKLQKHSRDDVKVYCPLSYGDSAYADSVVAYGAEKLGSKFIPMRSFMLFQDYIDFLADVDVAIFNHDRQQAMGNIVVLLGMGKTVFMNKGLTSYDFFVRKNIVIFGMDNLDIESRLSPGQSKSNRQIVADYFSRQNLKTSLSSLFS